MKKILVAIIIQGILLLTALGTETETKDPWSFEIMAGDAYCFNTPLRISQSGYDDIELTAHYDEISFETPIYYSMRIGKWHNDRAWELELVHLKIDLINTPEEVQRFEISHGYNLVTLNRAWKYKYCIFRLGAGIVISHPETTVRGKTYPDDMGLLNGGYYISGPTAQAAIGKRFYLAKGLFCNIEGKLTGSYAVVNIEDGHANVPNVAVHGLVGLGYDL